MSIRNLLFGTLYSGIACACFLSGDVVLKFVAHFYAMFAVDAIFNREAMANSINQSIKSILRSFNVDSD